jgi:hypothetical protein
MWFVLSPIWSLGHTLMTAASSPLLSLGFVSCLLSLGPAFHTVFSSFFCRAGRGDSANYLHRAQMEPSTLERSCNTLQPFSSDALSVAFNNDSFHKLFLKEFLLDYIIQYHPRSGCIFMTHEAIFAGFL